MNFAGMSIKSAHPGQVLWDPSVREFYWTIKVNGKTYYSPGHHATEALAKEAMNNAVARLRRQQRSKK